MTKSTDTPIRIAKQIDSKNPNVQPMATNMDVTAARMKPMVNVENRVRITDRLEIKMTAAAAPNARTAAP
jgi:hypothetical protein